MQERRNLMDEYEDTWGMLLLQAAVQLLLDSGDKEQALQRTRELLDQFPLVYHLRLWAVHVFAEHGDLSEALLHAALCVAIEPHEPIPYLYLSKTLKRLGNERLAEHVLNNGWEENKKGLGWKYRTKAQKRAKWFSTN